MNLQEAAVWIDGLFPGEMDIDQVGDFHVASFAADGQHIAVTLDFQQVDTHLEADGRDVRVELFTVAQQATGLPELLESTAGLIKSMAIQPQPGVLVPGAGALANVGITTSHCLLVVPFPWGGDVPNFKETGADGVDKLVLMLQVLPITDAELAHLQAYGLAELQSALVAEGVDILDLQR
ncbi:suppressor of fused domain protein [Corynebacterium sp. H128]|uniref:suppressor of fused domain protein n=1 Tax=unclassified Corynebacterium TaxID=2624378 RepID=UPI0030B1267C